MCVLLVVGVLGCETTNVTTSDGRPLPPEPTPLPRAPVGVLANSMAVRVGAKPIDTNGNGYPDLITVETYLFAEPFPTPIYEDGAFILNLYPGGRPDPGQTPLIEWRIESDAQPETRFQSPIFGPGYGFQLSLLEKGGDQYPLMVVNLACRFEPADGREPIDSTGMYAFQIGRRRGGGDEG